MDDSQISQTMLCLSHRSRTSELSSSSKDEIVSVSPPLSDDYQEDQQVPERTSITQNQYEYSAGGDLRKDYKLVPVLPPLPGQSPQDQYPAPPRSARTIPNHYHKDQYEAENDTIYEYQMSEEELKEKRIILVQSLARRWLVKRRYQKLAKTFRIRCEVVKEIITSEKRYNKQLLTMIEVFLKPLRRSLTGEAEDDEEDEEDDEEEMEEDDEEGVGGDEEEGEEKGEEDEEEEEEDVGYTEDDIFHIFSHLETIHNLSNVLIGLLEERYAHGWKIHRTLGDLFVQIGPFLKTLKQYVENYDNALQTLIRLKEDSEKFLEKIEQMEEDPRCLSLDLSSLLIAPVQRVPRYILLLETLKQNTPAEHPDYELLTQAISELKSVASFINKGIGGEKDLGVLAYLQGLADAQGSRRVDLIQTHRKMLKHGVLTKKSLRDGESSTRELYLLTDLLVVVADIMNVVSLQRIDKIIPLATATLIDNNIAQGCSKSFLVASPIKIFLFKCSDVDTKEQWMATIQTAITNLLHAHPINVKLREEWSVDFRDNEWQVTHVQEQMPDGAENENEDEEADGLAQLTNLQRLLTLSNRGNIRIKKACVGLVEEVFGANLQILDKCHHYIPDGTFLVFPPSEKLLWLISMTGFITLGNKGHSMILLSAHKRECGTDNHRTGKYFELLPLETKKFPFRGHWTIEVMGGNCADLQVISFSPSNGDSLPNLLGMVGKVIKGL